MLPSFPWFEGVSCCHGVNITPLFLRSVFRLLSFHTTNQHIRWVRRTLLQKLCIQTRSLFAYGSSESEGLYPGSRCLCSHMQILLENFWSRKKNNNGHRPEYPAGHGKHCGGQKQHYWCKSTGGHKHKLELFPLHLFKIIHVWMITIFCVPWNHTEDIKDPL